MNILVLNPPFVSRFSRTSRSPGVSLGGTLYYPFWLAYAVGVLEKSGFDVRFIDACADDYSLSQVTDLVSDFNPGLIVIDTSTPSIYNDVRVAEHLKQIFPSSFIVFVGTHPSAIPEETLQLSDKIDAVAVGEYDYTVRDLANCLAKGQDLAGVDGLVHRKNGEILRNKNRELIQNIDELPFVTQVYKKHLNIKNYFFGASDYPMAMIITGRGCPHKCFFCVYPQTFHSRKYRPRSASSIVDEFEYVTENLPQVKEIGIEDDTFTANQNRTIEFCRMIIERGIKIKWYCNVRVNLKLETMQWMKKAGCHLITVGFESADQDCLNQMRKGITVEQIRAFVKNTKKARLLVHGCFIVGNPGETKETLEKSLKVAKELNCDTMQFFPLIPYPGTEAYKWAKENGYLISEDYNNWANEDGMYCSVLNLPGLSPTEISVFCKRAVREYHLRPRYIIMKLKQIVFHPKEIARTIKGTMFFFKNFFSMSGK
ncbi:MAG: radical SAM protein [Chloroflexi bacterium]|jgi:anaerobic magnesium-protoporphyrin IX monomethyl ester cyclase|nr:radical SAM protein [Chloroflexota bacterium]